MPPDVALPGPRDTLHYRLIVDVLCPGLMTLMGGWHVAGRENVPQHGGALICPNHISYLDPPLVGAAAKRRCCYMARASLFTIPVIGPFIRSSYAYPVDRDEGGRQAIRIATTLLEAGELVVMFPEGTRSRDGELMPGEPGAAYIASRARVPVVPVAVWGMDAVLPLRAKRLYRCPAYVRIGEPMALPEPPPGERLSKAQLRAFTEQLMGRIAELQRQIKAEVPEKWLRIAEERKARLREAYARKHPD